MELDYDFGLVMRRHPAGKLAMIQPSLGSAASANGYLGNLRAYSVFN